MEEVQFVAYCLILTLGQDSLGVTPFSECLQHAKPFCHKAFLTSALPYATVGSFDMFNVVKQPQSFLGLGNKCYMGLSQNPGADTDDEIWLRFKRFIAKSSRAGEVE